MSRKTISILIIIISAFSHVEIFCQHNNSTAFKINTRLSFYSYEKEGEFLLHVPTNLTANHISVYLTSGNDTISHWIGVPGSNLLRLPFSINLSSGIYSIEAAIHVQSLPGVIYKTNTELPILSYKPNEVKTDRLTGGLIVNRLPFFPFGFYCYSPVHPALMEEEFVKGFNMIAPYQKILPETLNERKAYMDRCASLGMKVHYNLLSVSGGGGVGSSIEGLSDSEKRERLLNEIKTFRDHPALLGWYISDEPNGFNIPPEILEEIYLTVKENDPWHPVSIVFMAPFRSSGKYINALDIVMADPYPVPDAPVTMIGNVTAQLKSMFYGKKPVWIAQQAFGGGEWWWREPTIQEVRTMTYQAIIRGATGIQYFVRQGPNYFPKSTATWGECGRMAMEIAWLTPWLLSDERRFPVESYSDNVLVTSRFHNGQLIVMAVNKVNRPVNTSIRISGINNSKAKVVFENRSVTVSGGLISDQLSSYGSQVYLITLDGGEKSIQSSNPNLVRDPGFEDITSPGVPSACYARPGGDRGATFFQDSRVSYKGNNSVRLNTPAENKSAALRLFPFTVKAGSSYAISIWAKADPDQRFSLLPYQDISQSGEEIMPQYAEILLGDFGRARFVPDKEWRRFVTFVTIPTDTLPSFKTNLILKMPGQGVGWFDQISVIEE
jgi:hypothetical protein